mmetsp:Transcript_24908/g.34643  ORF Transcript_24908/g.34643 Transcript_24908/m.34643 type:complete len:131 (+) Transcript_24908:37-429(+)
MVIMTEQRAPVKAGASTTEAKANPRPVAITQPVKDTLTTMCPFCRQLMQAPSNASVIMCPKCSTKCEIRVKYTTYFKCSGCSVTLRCGHKENLVRCPSCEATTDVKSWRLRHKEEKKADKVTNAGPDQTK